MWLYSSILFALIFLSFCKYDAKVSVISNKIIFLEIVLLLFCLSAFRYGIETDYWSYFELFKNNGVGVETGFKILIYFVKNIFSNDFNVFIFVVATISVSIKFVCFSKVRNPFFAMLLYFCYFYIMLEWNVIRQGISVSFLFGAMDYAIKKRPIKFLFFVFCAVIFHISSIIFLPVYFIINQQYSLRKICILLFMFIIFKILFMDFVFNIMINSFSKMFPANLGVYAQRVVTYLKYETSSVIFSIGFFRRIVFLFIFICLNGSTKIKNPYFNVFFAGLFIYIFFMSNPIIANRLSISFEFMLVPMISDLKIKFTWRNFYYMFFLILISFSIFMMTLLNGNALPYKTYIFN